MRLTTAPDGSPACRSLIVVCSPLARSETVKPGEAVAGGMARAPLNLNRLLVAYAGLFTLGAIALFASTGTSNPAQFAPLLPGAIAALVLLFYHSRWMYLVGGILVAAFPILVLFVFGAYEAIIHPGSGMEGYSLLLLLVAAVLGLVGGIVGFAQSRRGTAPPASALLRAPQRSEERRVGR